MMLIIIEKNKETGLQINVDFVGWREGVRRDSENCLREEM